MTGRRFCAHADQNGEGAHWLEPGELCDQDDAATVEPGTGSAIAEEYPEIAAAIREDMASLAAMEQNRQ